MRSIKINKRIFLIMIITFCFCLCLISISSLAHSQSDIEIKRGWMTESGPDWECHCPATTYWDCVCIYDSLNFDRNWRF